MKSSNNERKVISLAAFEAITQLPYYLKGVFQRITLSNVVVEQEKKIIANRRKWP
jgi:hypothetical protein